MSKPGTPGAHRPPHRSMTPTDRTQPAHRVNRSAHCGGTQGTGRSERAGSPVRTVRTTEGSRR